MVTLLLHADEPNNFIILNVRADGTSHSAIQTRTLVYIIKTFKLVVTSSRSHNNSVTWTKLLYVDPRSEAIYCFGG